MRYASKQQLLDDIRGQHDALCALLREIPRSRHREAEVWGDGWTLHDLVAHLAEWQRLFLGWYEAGLEGGRPQLPASGYKWNETPRLNRAIRDRHLARSTAAVRADFETGYQRILELVEHLSPRQLLKPGAFAWTGAHPLATYLGPNTASHYRFAIEVVERWRKKGRSRRSAP
jgi:hypothetical protein